MDWNLKAPSWDLSELEQETFSNLEPVDGSSSFGDHHHHHHYRSIKGNFTVDLKLGQLGDSGNNELVNMLKEHGAPKATSSPSGPSKRSRAAYNGSQTVTCLVDGCNSDLSTCRDYHRRHKVCELHSKTPMVTINGQKQRFCQQCSRFHSLEEFDEGKRSCRKRLDGHNRRRRKPQPEPLMRSGSFLSSYQGTQLLPFSSSLVYPSTTVVNPTWAGVVKPEADTTVLHNQHLQHQNMFLGSSTSSSYNKGGGNKQQFTLFQSRNNSQTISAHGASICQPLLNTISLSETASSAKSKMFCDRLTTSRIHPDSDCALSLLSSPQTQQQTSDLGLRHMVHRPNSISQMHHHHHHISGLHGNNNSSSVESMDSVLVSHGSSSDHANNVHPGMFHMGSDGSQGNHHHQGHQGPFHWG